VVLANHVLEHVPEEARALAEIRRILKPGGWAMLQVPIALGLDHTREEPGAVTDADRERLYGQSDHVRLYGLDYPTRLEAAGFSVRRYQGHGERGEEFLARWILNPREWITLVTRPARDLGAVIG
jgi:SAM-dependent methyltransferase